MEAVQRRDGESRLQWRSIIERPSTDFSYAQVDAIVSSVNRMGVFADVGPLPVFVSNHVCLFDV